MTHKIKYIFLFLIGISFIVGIWYLVYYLGVVLNHRWWGAILGALILKSTIKTIRVLPYDIIALFKVLKSNEPENLIDEISELREKNQLNRINSIN
jgi:hypothetical protein